MGSYDGWTLNKKLDEIKEDIEKKYMLLGAKLLQLEERINRLDAETQKKWIKPKKGSDSTGVS